MIDQREPSQPAPPTSPAFDLFPKLPAELRLKDLGASCTEAGYHCPSWPLEMQAPIGSRRLFTIALFKTGATA